MNSRNEKQTVSRVNIGGHWVGDAQPCFIIAEAGSNHNVSLD